MADEFDALAAAFSDVSDTSVSPPPRRTRPPSCLRRHRRTARRTSRTRSRPPPFEVPEYPGLGPCFNESGDTRCCSIFGSALRRAAAPASSRLPRRRFKRRRGGRSWLLRLPLPPTGIGLVIAWRVQMWRHSTASRRQLRRPPVAPGAAARRWRRSRRRRCHRDRSDVPRPRAAGRRHDDGDVARRRGGVRIRRHRWRDWLANKKADGDDELGAVVCRRSQSQRSAADLHRAVDRVGRHDARGGTRSGSRAPPEPPAPPPSPPVINSPPQPRAAAAAAAGALTKTLLHSDKICEDGSMATGDLDLDTCAHNAFAAGYVHRARAERMLDLRSCTPTIDYPDGDLYSSPLTTACPHRWRRRSRRRRRSTR